MNNATAAELDYYFTDPETSIFNRKLVKKVNIIRVKGPKPIEKAEDLNLEDSTWTQIFYNRKDNPTFKRRYKAFLIKVGAYAELYPKEMEKPRVLFDDQKSINKLSFILDKDSSNHYKKFNTSKTRAIFERRLKSLLSDPEAIERFIKVRKALVKKKSKIISDAITLSRIEKESPLFEKYKKLDPLNISGKVRSSKGLLIQWGHNTKYITFIEKKKKEWKILFFQNKIKMPAWNKVQKRYLRHDINDIGKFLKNKTQSLDMRYIWTKLHFFKTRVDLHGHKALLMQRELLKNVLVGDDILENYRKFDLIKARNFYKFRMGGYNRGFILNYFGNLTKNANFFGYKEDLYNFYNIKINRPFMYKKYKHFLSLMRGKGRYNTEYW
jgi:hypothetical protein